MFLKYTARGGEELPDPSLILTVGHLPALVAPTLRCPRAFPFGAQFVSHRWNDYLLLQGVKSLLIKSSFQQAVSPSVHLDDK